MIKLGMNRKFALILFFFIASAILFTIIINSKRRLILGTTTSLTSPDTTVSTAIGERRLTIFGWAPALSQIKLDGVAVYDSVTAASDGSFLISGIYLPLVALYPEICLQAQDSIGRTTQPTCLPRLKAGKYNYTVGPVLLSPTLSLEKGEIIKGDLVAASGQTTPKTQVDIFLARAYSIPKYQIKSDATGNFGFNLPTETVDKWRVFAGAEIFGAASAKSNTLTFQVHPLIYSLWLMLKRLFELLRPYLIYLVILIEVVILAHLLLKRHRHPLR